MEAVVVEPLEDVRQSSDYFPDEGLRLAVLQYGELLGCVFCDFEEGVACHLHDPGKLFLHKFKELLDDCLEEGPIVPEETRKLTDYVHNAGGNHSLVFLSCFVLAQLQQSPKGADEEGSFLAFLDAAAERADDPRERVEALKVETMGLKGLDLF